MKEIICIVGPTATGKTKLSVALAKALDGEIVSCDSMQLYRGMDIGTAKPTVAEMDGIPHHMMDCIDPNEDYSVCCYVNQADACVRDVLARGKKAIIVGGTGLYVDSLISGREFARRPETGIRQELTKIAAEQGISVLVERLRAVDPEAAAAIPAANEKRIIRALEVYLETGIPISEHNRQSKLVPKKYEAAWIGLDYVNRTALYGRIDQRVEEMFEQGLVPEVKALLDRGIREDSTAMQAIGYKELVAYFRGETTLEEAKALIQQRSRNYAKRQRTWFRRNSEISWIDLPDAPEFGGVLQQAREILLME